MVSGWPRLRGVANTAPYPPALSPSATKARDSGRAMQNTPGWALLIFRAPITAGSRRTPSESRPEPGIIPAKRSCATARARHIDAPGGEDRWGACWVGTGRGQAGGDAVRLFDRDALGEVTGLVDV